MEESRPAAAGEELILGDPTPAAEPPGAGAASAEAPQARVAPASSPTALAGEREPLVIERSIVVPVPAQELDGGRRKVRLVLDVTLDPQG